MHMVLAVLCADQRAISANVELNNTSLGGASSTRLQLQVGQPGQLRQAGGDPAAEGVPMQVHLHKSGPIPAAGDAACEPVQAQVQNLQLLCLGQICKQLRPFRRLFHNARYC